jgi:hypothetical protein
MREQQKKKMIEISHHDLHKAMDELIEGLRRQEGEESWQDEFRRELSQLRQRQNELKEKKQKQ